jgi:NADH:ubiquinone oxidoreductase subunit 3 (subunit A)
MFYFLEYIFIFKFFIITDLIIFILFFLSFFSVFQNIDFEKFSIYECGFIPFIHTRTKFGVHFYLVGVIFVIFDVELSFLIP